MSREGEQREGMVKDGIGNKKEEERAGKGETGSRYRGFKGDEREQEGVKRKREMETREERGPLVVIWD